jgi:predicted RND superfamily exporter protein
LLLLPLLALEGNSLTSSNSVETWLPEDALVRQQYEFFKECFGTEELILIGLPMSEEDPLVEAIAGRIENQSEIRACWTPVRMRRELESLGVDADRAQSQITGFTLPSSGGLVGLAAFLSTEGVEDRAAAVAAVQDVLSYCQIARDEVLLAGAPVTVTELDRLGSLDANRFFLGLALSLGVFVVWSVCREWKLTAGIVFETLFAIQLTLAIYKWVGGEISVVLSALPMLVMVFTMSNAICVVQCFHASKGEASSSVRTIRGAIKPCLLSAAVTVLGLVSLRVSNIVPVRDFAFAGTIGVLVSLFSSLIITPALLVIFPQPVPEKSNNLSRLQRKMRVVHRHAFKIAAASLALIACCTGGLAYLKPSLSPLDFLPANSIVRQNTLEIDKRITPVDSIELIVDFGTDARPFAEKLAEVRAIEAKLATYPEVKHTLSLASFFPARPSDAAQLCDQSHDSRLDYLATGERFWRISARVRGESAQSETDFVARLRAAFAGRPITVTGAPAIIQQAQQEILISLRQSFAFALAAIYIVTAISLRAPLTALVAMIPTAGPVLVVFGLLGNLGCPVDIGMMLASGIAIGLAAKGSFCFLLPYQQKFREHRDVREAVEFAMSRAGGSIVLATAVAALAMLPLMLSGFAPTMRFGGMMALLLAVSMIADVVVLPALLCLRPRMLLGWLHRPAVSRDLDEVPAPPLPEPWLNPPHVQLAPMGPMKVGKI